MNAHPDYLDINRKLWNEKVSWHLRSDMYHMESFRQGRNSLTEVEQKLFGDVAGKSILHLQCHFGQDTLSLARMGARVTGVDLSDEAIATASNLAAELNINARFIASDVYALPDVLNEQFDVVYTSFGTIGWLPDLQRWASVVNRFLKPGGQFVFAEFHPVVWMYDNDFTHVAYSYFTGDAIIENETGTYANREAPIQHQSISWNHSLGEVIGCLLEQGLELKHFAEYNYSPFDCFLHTEKIGERRYIIKPFGDKVPLFYSLTAQKPS